jgi:hypothetical protein
MSRKKQTPTGSKKSDLGMQSVKYGLDNKPEITKLDTIAKFVAKDKKSKFMGGGIAYAGGGRAMKRKGGKV